MWLNSASRVLREGKFWIINREFPKELGKSSCAFANAYGGIIIIGVRTDYGVQCPYNT